METHFSKETVEDIAIRTVDDINDHLNQIDYIVVIGDIFDGNVVRDIEKITHII